LLGAGGGMLLVIATANPFGIAAFANVYAPGPFVVLILALLAILAFEGGLHALRRPGSVVVQSSPTGALLGALVGVAALVSILGLSGRAVMWAVSQIQRGLQPTSESYVAVGTLGLYAVLRVVVTLSGLRGDELARSIGIQRAEPDPGETNARFTLRMVIGFLFGIPLLDSLIVFAAVALAPDDPRIYPYPSDATLAAALLWFVGIAAVASGVTGYIRGRGARRTALHVVLATALIPAFLLDARVPLYPFVAGIYEQQSSGAPTKTVPPAALSTASRASAAPSRPGSGATSPSRLTTQPPAGFGTLAGTVTWGTTPVRDIPVTVLRGGALAGVGLSDVNGRYRVQVEPGQYSAVVDMTALTRNVYVSAGSPGTSVRVSGGAETLYPPLTLMKLITAVQPAGGAVLTVPITFAWQPLDTTMSYELRVLDDTAADPSTGRSPLAFSTRTSNTSVVVTSLGGGRRYRWLVDAYGAATDVRQSFIGQSIVRLFSTR
jgi:hypothetical protein